MVICRLGPEFLSSDPRLSALPTRGRKWDSPRPSTGSVALSRAPQVVRVFPFGGRVFICDAGTDGMSLGLIRDGYLR